MGDWFKPTQWTQVPFEDEMKSPLAFGFLIVFAIGFVVSLALYLRPPAAWKAHPVKRTFTARYTTWAMWAFGFGLVFYLFQLMGLPFLGWRVWAWISIVLVVATLAAIAYNWSTAHRSRRMRHSRRSATISSSRASVRSAMTVSRRRARPGRRSVASARADPRRAVANRRFGFSRSIYEKAGRVRRSPRLFVVLWVAAPEHLASVLRRTRQQGRTAAPPCLICKRVAVHPPSIELFQLFPNDQLKPSDPTTPGEFPLRLLPSGPDLVRGTPPRGTRLSTHHEGTVLQPLTSRGNSTPVERVPGYRVSLTPHLAQPTLSVANRPVAVNFSAARTCPGGRGYNAPDRDAIPFRRRWLTRTRDEAR